MVGSLHRLYSECLDITHVSSQQWHRPRRRNEMVYMSIELIASELSWIAASCVQTFSGKNYSCSRDIPWTWYVHFHTYLQPKHTNKFFSYQYYIPTCKILNSTHLVDGSRASPWPGASEHERSCFASTWTKFVRIPQEHDFCNLTPCHTSDC